MTARAWQGRWNNGSARFYKLSFLLHLKLLVFYYETRKTEQSLSSVFPWLGSPSNLICCELRAELSVWHTQNTGHPQKQLLRKRLLNKAHLCLSSHITHTEWEDGSRSSILGNVGSGKGKKVREVALETRNNRCACDEKLR